MKTEKTTSDLTGDDGNIEAPRFFYGWVLVAILLFLLSVGTGTSIYMFSVVASAVGQEFPASRAVMMLGFTGMLLMVGLLSPLLGTLLDRYPSRWILLGGSAAMGLGFVLLAVSTNIWMVVAGYALLISIGVGTLSPLVMATLLTRWFVRRRGFAIGIAALGTQLGGLLYPPLFAAVMDAYSWRIAIGGLGVILMTLLPCFIWFLVADRPADRGQRAYGSRATTPAGIESIPSSASLTLLQLLKSRNFLLVILIVGAINLANTTLLANLSLFATDIGESPLRGAYLVSLAAFLGIVSSPLIGWLCDVVSIKLVSVIVMLTLALSCLIFSLASNYPLLLIAVFFQGIGGGGVYPLWASLVARLYETVYYGRVMGLITCLVVVATASGPLLGGWVYDATSSNRVLLWALFIILLALALCPAFMRLPRNR